eukprot:2374386-Rhodomonas_salina.4
MPGSTKFHRHFCRVPSCDREREEEGGNEGKVERGRGEDERTKGVREEKKAGERERGASGQDDAACDQPQGTQPKSQKPKGRRRRETHEKRVKQAGLERTRALKEGNGGEEEEREERRHYGSAPSPPLFLPKRFRGQKR